MSVSQCRYVIDGVLISDHITVHLHVQAVGLFVQAFCKKRLNLTLKPIAILA